MCDVRIIGFERHLVCFLVFDYFLVGVFSDAERSEEGEEDDYDDNDGDGNMDVDAAKPTDEVSHAMAVAGALGKASKSKNSARFDDIADGLKELDMDHYDDEDEGASVFNFIYFSLVLFDVFERIKGIF